MRDTSAHPDQFSKEGNNQSSDDGCLNREDEHSNRKNSSRRKQGNIKEKIVCTNLFAY